MPAGRTDVDGAPAMELLSGIRNLGVQLAALRQDVQSVKNDLSAVKDRVQRVDELLGIPAEPAAGGLQGVVEEIIRRTFETGRQEREEETRRIARQVTEDDAMNDGLLAPRGRVREPLLPEVGVQQHQNGIYEQRLGYLVEPLFGKRIRDPR